MQWSQDQVFWIPLSLFDPEIILYLKKYLFYNNFNFEVDFHTSRLKTSNLKKFFLIWIKKAVNKTRKEERWKFFAGMRKFSLPNSTFNFRILILRTFFCGILLRKSTIFQRMDFAKFRVQFPHFYFAEIIWRKSVNFILCVKIEIFFEI